jgi:hypothetical protein
MTEKFSMSGYMVPLIILPTIIHGPGKYRTRGGEVVEVEAVSRRPDFRCSGRYANGTREGWNKSGRLYAGVQCRNDIITKEGE